MRSRDGSSSIILRIFSIILLLSSLALNAKEFLISYRYVVKDAMLYNEMLYISNSMKKCSGKPQEALMLTDFVDDNLKLTISENSEEFIEYIHKLGIHVEHEDSTINYENRSTTVLTLKTTCFKVDFNDTFVKIAPLK